MIETTLGLRAKTKTKKPLIHCITNPISINGCANVILSVGAKPMMAEHPEEVREITEIADALMLNLGNITDARMASMEISLAYATKKRSPVLLDAVGVACSALRRRLLQKLLAISSPSVIKGNYSEIAAIYDGAYSSPGVDADSALDICTITQAAEALARTYQTVILATGEVDIVSDGVKTVHLKNGTKQLATVTGTGCMLGSLCASFLPSAVPLDAAVSACCYFGICGELAETEKGGGTFYMNLLDNLSNLTKEEISKRMNMEEFT